MQFAINKLAVAVVGVLYVVSLVLPAIGTAGGYNEAQLGLGKENPGFWVLVLSGGTCFMLNPMWLANPLLWAGLWLMWRRKWRVATVVAVLSALFAIGGSVAFMQWTSGGDNYELLFGYYVWAASTVSLVLMAVAGWALDKPPASPFAPSPDGSELK